MRSLNDIEYGCSGAVAILTLNRPEVLNAMRDESISELCDVVEHLHRSPDIRAVILTGKGRGFCSGEDLSELDAALSQSGDDGGLEQKFIRLQGLTRRIVDLQIPTIAAVNGPAVGLGAELAMNCDVRLAGESASFAFPEVKHGLSVTNAGMYFLPRLIGHGHMLELLLTGSRIDAHHAEAIGLVNKVVPDSELLEDALSLAQTMASHSRSALSQVKQAAARAWTSTIDETLRFEAETALQVLRTEVARQGVSIFNNSRNADRRKAADSPLTSTTTQTTQTTQTR